MTNKETILIVEDDQDIRSIYSTVLKLKGFSVLTAENGKVALDMLEELDDKQLPDCILLDLMMPVMDGRSFLNQFNTKKRISCIPILVTTALGEDETQNLPTSPKVLKKPIGIDLLLSEIEGAV